VKRSLLVEQDGGPLAVGIAGAKVPDAQLLAATSDAVVVERPEPEPDWPQHRCLDKGYDNPTGGGLTPQRRWLDVGCGTGALTQTVIAVTDPATVTGIDASEGYVAYARGQIDDSRADFRTGDAQGLPFEPASFDAAVPGLMLNFLPRLERGVAEIARVTRGPAA
jgi:SAM-dependent methyltransferase